MKNCLKKSLAFLLAFMMVFSYIAYVEPIEAEARATINTYRKADKYGTPVWDGKDTYYSKWNSGSSYTTFTWPRHIYMDISETLESAGYYYTVEWDYGNGTDYRIVNNGFIFGGWRLDSTSLPANYYTMTNMFNNYDLDASTHGTQDGIDGGSSTDFDLKIGNDNWDGAQVIIWRNPNGDNSAQHQYVFMKGTPKTTGYGLYSTSGAKPTSFGGWQYWSSGWKNASDKYTTSNDSGNWTTDCYEGTWKEVRFEITIYDKSDLNFAMQKSSSISTSNTPYVDYVTAGLDNYIAQHNAAEALLKTREVTQAGLTTQITNLSNAANALRFAASNSVLTTAINAARAKMAEANYATKYTEASRNALAAALNNATSSSYDEGVTTYAINFSDDSTWNAGEKADKDQTAINNYATAINNAIAGLKSAYSITFEFANGTTDTKIYDAGATVSVPANSKKASDATNHYSYSWTPSVSTIANANATYKEELKTVPHSWSEWTQTKAPTCTAEGSKQRNCTVCGYVETVAVDMIAHVEKTREENRVEPTCDKAGSYDIVTYCEKCGQTLDTETIEIPATGAHEYTTEIDRVPATCTEDGYYVMQCKCGATQTTKLTAPGHSPADAVQENRKEPSCTVPGSYDEVVYCTVCTEELSRTTQSIPVVDHVPAEAVTENLVDATCTSEGSYDKVVYCKNCDTELSRVPYTIDKIPHEEAEAVTENVVDATCTSEGSYDKVVYCKNCDTELSRVPYTIDKIPHEEAEAVTENLVPATCTSAGSYDEVVYCKNCDTELSRVPHTIDKLDHEADEAVIENKVPATCTSEGSYDKVVYCKNCPTELSRTPHTIDKIPHEADDAETENVVDATCTAEGSYDEVVYCKNCPEELSRVPHTIDKIPHEADEAVKEKEKEATCTAEGYYESVVYCSVCNEELSRTPVDVPMADHEYVKHEAQLPSCSEGGWFAYESCKNCEYNTYKYIAATGEHIYATEVEKVEATCLEDGYMIMACKCGATERTELKATDHDWGNWEVDTPATCTEGGVEKRVCKNDADHFETKPIAATGHTPADAVTENLVDATCTAEGSYDKVVYCENCSEELSRDSHTIEMLEHEAAEAVTENLVDATCTAEGSYDEVVYCENCSEELSRDSHTIDKLSHEAAEAVIENKVPATCTAAGSYDEVVYCSVCHEELSRDSHTIDKLSHEAAEAVIENKVPATCTSAGSYDEVVYCSVCHEELSRTPVNVPIKDHQYVDHAAQIPTCSEGGWNAYQTCENCDYSTYEYIAATGKHVYTQKEKLDATCLEDGYIIMACECGKEETTIIKAVGSHAWSEWIKTKAPTATEDGEETRICESCGEKRIRIIPAHGTGTQDPTPTPDQPDAPDKDPSENCGCSCHSKNALVKFFFKLFNFIRQLFGMKQYYYCECGITHW